MPESDPNDLPPPSDDSPAPPSMRMRRAAVAALTDLALVAAMRQGDAHAWAEFDGRFRPSLVAYTRRVRLTDDLTEADVADTLVDDLLADEGARLTAPNAPVVPVVAAYLLRAAKHRLINLKRDAARRARRHASAATRVDGEQVVTSLYSEYTLRSSGGAAGSGVVREGAPSAAVADVASALRAVTTIEEQQMLGWVAQRIPYRTIAGWLGVSYEAATKRITRLTRRLRAAAVCHAESAAPARRAEIERFLRRAGGLPPLVSAPPPRYHAVGTTVIPVNDHDR